MPWKCWGIVAQRGFCCHHFHPAFLPTFPRLLPWLFLRLWFLQPFSRGQSWLAFVGLISHPALLRVEFLSPRIIDPGRLHRGRQQTFPTIPEEGFPICVPFNVADPLPQSPGFWIFLSQIQGKRIQWISLSGRSWLVSGTPQIWVGTRHWWDLSSLKIQRLWIL